MSLKKYSRTQKNLDSCEFLCFKQVKEHWSIHVRNLLYAAHGMSILEIREAKRLAECALNQGMQIPEAGSTEKITKVAHAMVICCTEHELL